MEQSESLPMCKQSSESPASGGGAAVTYTAFLDALLTNVCCADIGNSDVYDSAADFVVSGDEGGVIGSSSPSPNGRGGDEDNAATLDNKALAESILPHLRFNPLINSSASPLDEFFDLFLKDDARHSFLSFHKSKGDEEVKATPWKMGQEEDKLERTITFITKFTPKNLQEEQDKDVTAPSSTITTDVNNPTLTLAVTSHQTLSRKPSIMILENLLSFDFVDYSLLKTSLSNMLNVSLTQFLISNDVKGSEVKVRIVLNEEDGGITSTAVPAASSIGKQPPVTHPFLLPDKLPSLSEDAHSENVGEHDNHDDENNNDTDFSPTQVGASLLSLIRARNCPTPSNSTSPKRNNPVDEAALLIAKHSESLKSKDSANTLERDVTDDTYDVLRTGSSRGSLKFKHVSSFETSVNPGEMAMRRILWEKDRSGTATSESNISNALEGGDPSISSLLQPFDMSSRGGLSMHIEMEVRDNSSFNNDNNTTLRRSASLTSRTRSNGNSSFQRTRSTGIAGPSITYIEEKVRKGLKKRVARSSVTWATSWCCRLWEDEQMDRFLKRGNPTPMVRKRSNTRPTVRRIGERKKKSKSPARGGRIGKNQTAPNTEMEKLQAMKKQIQQAESMKKQPRKPRVVTPTSSPTHEKGSAWFPLQLEDGIQCCRWMSSEDEEGQSCGVEVCTISPDDESKRSKESGSGMKKKFIRGLKSKS